MAFIVRSYTNPKRFYQNKRRSLNTGTFLSCHTSHGYWVLVELFGG